MTGLKLSQGRKLNSALQKNYINTIMPLSIKPSPLKHDYFKHTVAFSVFWPLVDTQLEF